MDSIDAIAFPTTDVFGLRGGAHVLPPGDIQPLRIWDCANATIQAHQDGTTALANHPARPAVDIRAAYHCTFDGIQVRSAVADCVAGFQVSSQPVPFPAYGPTTRCVFRDCGANPPGNGNPFIDGMVIGGFQANDDGQGNNDLHLFDSCYFKLFTRAAVRITTSQAQQLRFFRCAFLGDCDGQIGIWGEYGSFYTAEDCTTSSLKDVDILAYNACTQVTLTGWNSEGGRQLLRTGGPSSAGFPVTIRGSRFDSHFAAGPMIDYNVGGMLIIEGGPGLCSRNMLPNIRLHAEATLQLTGVQLETEVNVPVTFRLVSGGTAGRRTAYGCKIADQTTEPWTFKRIPADPMAKVN